MQPVARDKGPVAFCTLRDVEDVDDRDPSLAGHFSDDRVVPQDAVGVAGQVRGELEDLRPERRDRLIWPALSLPDRGSDGVGIPEGDVAESDAIAVPGNHRTPPAPVSVRGGLLTAQRGRPRTMLPAV